MRGLLIILAALTATPSLAGQNWISTTELAQKFTLQEQRDALSGRIILSGNSIEVTICPGLRLVKVNGSTIELVERVRYQGDKVLLPRDLLGQLPALASLRPVRPNPVNTDKPRRLRLVIDPGHGGKDPGAIGPTGVTEKQVNLAIGRKLAQLLEARGAEAVLTRRDDRYVSLEQRSNIANRVQPDLFISIHANSARAGYVAGFETYYLAERFIQERSVTGFMAAGSGQRHGYSAGSYDDTGRALVTSRYYAPPTRQVGEFSGGILSRQILWNLLLGEYRRESKALAQTIQHKLARVLDAPDRGIKTAGFSVLKWTYAPAVLVEVGFLSNRRWERRLDSDSTQDEIAAALCQAVLEVARSRTPASR